MHLYVVPITPMCNVVAKKMPKGAAICTYVYLGENLLQLLSYLYIQFHSSIFGHWIAGTSWKFFKAKLLFCYARGHLPFFKVVIVTYILTGYRPQILRHMTSQQFFLFYPADPRGITWKGLPGIAIQL